LWGGTTHPKRGKFLWASHPAVSPQREDLFGEYPHTGFPTKKKGETPFSKFSQKSSGKKGALQKIDPRGTILKRG